MTKSTDVRTPGIQAIAKKWNMSVSEIMRLVNDGAKVEKEHTKSIAKARQVARDHIAERPDYYKKLHKMEKTPISMKEETGISGVRGLGFVSGDPATDPINQYVTTNTMSYEDYNGAVLKLIRDRHNKHLNDMGFTSYSPNEIQHSTNKIMEESDESSKALVKTVAKKKLKDIQGKKKSQALRDKLTRKMNLKELGEYDNKGGTVDAEGLSDAPKKDMKEGHIGFGSWGNFGDGFQYSRKNTYGKRPKPKPESNEPGTGDTYKDSKQGGSKVKTAKTVKEDAATVAAMQHMDTAKAGEYRPARQGAQRLQGNTYRAGQNFSSQSLNVKPSNMRMGSNYGTMKPTTTDVRRNISNRFNAGFGQQGTGAMKPTSVGGSSSFSQGGSQVAQKMAKSSPSQVISKMSDAGRQAATVVSKAAPTAAKVAGTIARVAAGPAATAAAAVMSPTPAGEKKSEFQRQADVAKGVSYKAQGRSVSDYEKQVLTPKTYDKPKAPENPKVDAPTPPSRPDYFSRGQAFGAARKEAGGGEGKFSYDNKEYQTNVSGEKYKPAAQLKQTSVQESQKETKMSNELIKEAIENIAEENLSEMKENLMLALQEKAMEKLEERKKEIAANYFAQ